MKKKSQAFTLVLHVWQHCPFHGDSWTRLNSTMQAAVALAISAGLKFHTGDFPTFLDDFRGHRWFGADDGEQFYSQAVDECNISAAQAYEHWRDRSPFIADNVTPGRNWESRAERKRERLAVGSRFTWNGQCVTVTSFATDGSYLTACSYKDEPEGSYKHRPDKRYRITVADIKADRKARKKPKRRVNRC